MFLTRNQSIFSIRIESFFPRSFRKDLRLESPVRKNQQWLLELSVCMVVILKVSPVPLERRELFRQHVLPWNNSGFIFRRKVETHC